MEKILLHTKRLKVRNLKESDLDEFYAYRSNPEITRYQGFSTFSREDSLNFIIEHSKKMLILPGEWIQFAIEHNSNQKLVGDCAIYLHQADSRIAEIGITISHLHQRQGYAREAMFGLMEFLFVAKGVHRIVETVDAENTASIQMLKSLSFRQEAHFHENIFFKGKWGSEYQFAMLSKEWDDLNLSIP